MLKISSIAALITTFTNIANADVTCTGKIYENSLKNKVAEARCTHDGTGAGTYSCKGTWRLRNVKGVEAPYQSQCSVIRGDKDKFCFSDEQVAGDKIKEEVEKLKMVCTSS